MKKIKKPKFKKEDEDAPKKNELIVRPTEGRLVDIYADDDDSTIKSIEAMAASLAGRKNRDTHFQRLSDVRQRVIELPQFALQFLFQNRFIDQGSVLEIIGPEGCGKTTLALTIASYFMMQQKASVMWMNADSKDMRQDHIHRILHTDPVQGKAMMDNIKYFKPHSLDQMWEAMWEFVQQERGLKKKAGKRSVCLPINQPLVVIVDPFGRLMSPDEAQGFQLYGSLRDEKDSRTMDGLLGGTNFGHAKFAARWTRRLAYMCDALNVMLIVISEQNTKIDMGGAGAKFALPDSYVQARNKTKLGGGALNKAAAYQIIIGPSGVIKNAAGDVMGKSIRARMDKNSHGPHNAEITYELHETAQFDGPGYLEPVLQFDTAAADLIMGTNTTDLTLGVAYDWPSQDMYGRNSLNIGFNFHRNIEMVRRFAELYRIRGYADHVQLAVEAAKQLRLTQKSST